MSYPKSYPNPPAEFDYQKTTEVRDALQIMLPKELGLSDVQAKTKLKTEHFPWNSPGELAKFVKDITDQKDIKSADYVLSQWQENFSEVPEYEAPTWSGAEASPVSKTTLTSDESKQLIEELEAKEAKREKIVSEAETSVDTAIKRKQEIFAQQIKAAQEFQKKHENDLAYLRAKEEAQVALDEEQKARHEKFVNEVQKNPESAIKTLANDIKVRAGDEVSDNAALAAATYMAAYAQNPNLPAETAALEELKNNPEYSAWAPPLANQMSEAEKLARMVADRAYGPNNPFVPKQIEVEVSDTSAPGYTSFSPGRFAYNSEGLLKNQSEALSNPNITKPDYMISELDRQLALIKAGGIQGAESNYSESLVQGYLTYYKPGASIDPGVVGSKLEVATGASNIFGPATDIAKGVAKQTVQKGLAKAIVSLAAKAGAPASGGLTLLAAQAANWVVDHVNPRTVKKWFLVGLAAPAIAIGIAFGIPAALFGGLALGGYGLARAQGLTLGNIASGVAGVAGAIGAATLGAIGTPILITLLGFPVVVAIILFIINSGAYIVPPSLSSAADQNQFVSVTKNANPSGPFDNGKLPSEISYTVTVTAKKKPLTVTSTTNECVVITNAGQQNCPAPEVTFDKLIPAGSSLSQTYSVKYNGNYKDAVILDTVTVNATVEGEDGDQTSSGSSSIIVGDPPTGCFEFDKSWKNQAVGQANITKAINKMLAAKTYMATLCQGNKKITLTYSSKGVGYGGEIIGGGITLYRPGVYISDLVTLYTLAHESGHIYAIRTNVDEEFKDNDGVGRDGFICSYPMGQTADEDFAETIALYISKVPGSVKASCIKTSFKIQYPNHWNFAKNKIFYDNLGW